MPPTKQEIERFKLYLGVWTDAGTAPLPNLLDAAVRDIPGAIPRVARDEYLAECFAVADLDGGFVPAASLVRDLNSNGHSYSVSVAAILIFLGREFLEARFARPISFETIGDRRTAMNVRVTVNSYVPLDFRGEVLMVRGTADLERWWKLSLGAEPSVSGDVPKESEEPSPAEPEGDAEGPKRRRCYQRDHLWLKWLEDGHLKKGEIRDRWNKLSDKQRKKLCPNSWTRIATGKSGWYVVRTALKKARKETGGS